MCQLYFHKVLYGALVTNNAQQQVEVRDGVYFGIYHTTNCTTIGHINFYKTFSKLSKIKSLRINFTSKLP